MNNLPSKYKNDINIESNIRSVIGMNNKDLSDLPTEITTFKDLFVKRQTLPQCMNFHDEYDVLTDILESDINMNDIDDKNINTREDFKLSLFSLLTDGDNVFEDNEKYTNQEVWGSDISAVVADNVMILARPNYFNLSGSIKKPDTDVNNILLFEEKNDRSIYVFTESSREDIKNMPVDGLPSENAISKVSSQFLDRMCAILNIGAPEENIDSFKTMQDEFLLIKSQDMNLVGVIAPLVNDSIEEILAGNQNGRFEHLNQ
jgi:hypothetical protein